MKCPKYIIHYHKQTQLFKNIIIQQKISIETLNEMHNINILKHFVVKFNRLCKEHICLSHDHFLQETNH